MDKKEFHRRFKLCLLLALALVTFQTSYAQKVSSGNLTKYKDFASEFIGQRDVYVWTPSDYSKKHKYSVLYMHDGEMLFDSLTTWNKQEWQMDETADKLMKQGKTEDFIIVGVPCSKKRFYEYLPQKALDYLTPETSKRIESVKSEFSADKYLSFLVNELKPFIDKNYSTKKDAAHTFTMGSSMGGLISLYAVCEYPDVFGGAACMSIHTPMIASEDFNNEDLSEWAEAYRDYLNKALPKANSNKIIL